MHEWIFMGESIGHGCMNDLIIRILIDINFTNGFLAADVNDYLATNARMDIYG